MINPKLIKKNINLAVDKIEYRPLGKRFSGKVRDWYDQDHLRVLITTDRISAFDKVLGLVPFRGTILTKLSQFWFDQTRDIIPNHMIGVIDPNVMLVSRCQPIPLEIIVRGYITGITKTSVWKKYSDGERIIYGIKFPNNLKKNQKLQKPIITPTTKAPKDKHDQLISAKDAIQQKLISLAFWKQIEKTSLSLYERGSKIYQKAGFILADTKYEFGLDRNNKLILIDEIHTPDSSRLWDKKTYLSKFKKGQEVENYDKEIMRLWLGSKDYSGGKNPPQIPNDLIVKIARRYIEVFENVMGTKFTIDLTKPPKERILESLTKLI